ncbi:MAG: hypothetical protein G01um101416_288 [Microgenomates group bacterium Gr01-1014_16]|nr:MAG: hypothetical protein G01um101416_288 [Microgenomates group bacterium Gr01-1014_16]
MALPASIFSVSASRDQPLPHFPVPLPASVPAAEEAAEEEVARPEHPPVVASMEAAHP